MQESGDTEVRSISCQAGSAESRTEMGSARFELAIASDLVTGPQAGILDQTKGPCA